MDSYHGRCSSCVNSGTQKVLMTYKIPMVKNGLVTRFVLSASSVMTCVRPRHVSMITHTVCKTSSDIIGFRAHHGGSSCYVHTTRN